MRQAWMMVAVASLSGCFYPGERGRLLEARVDKLTAENEALAAKVTKSEASVGEALPKIDQKIGEVTAALESLDNASRRSSADVGVQVQKLVDDVAKLRGEVETYVFKIDELETGLKKLQEETGQKLTALEGSSAAKEAEAKRKAEELKRPADKGDFLALANEKAKAGELALARQLYLEWLKKWPKDPLGAEAHLGLGDTYAKDDRCREALYEYQRVIEDHAKSKLVPDAFVRSSDCFAALKMNAESKLALEEVVKSYPKSDAAKTAKQKLAELEKKKPAPAPKKKGTK